MCSSELILPEGHIMHISWDLPAFRPGFWGIIDKFIGPGATTAEKNIQLFLPFLFSAGVVAIGLYSEFNWSVVQYVIIALLAGDMVGGVVTNATSAAKW